ncbi:MAG: hypothetical protein J7L04_01835 [Bacteroidales bacterium]|nr:hypothetical protein [Bacteroidales bacterium]
MDMFPFLGGDRLKAKHCNTLLISDLRVIQGKYFKNVKRTCLGSFFLVGPGHPVEENVVPGDFVGEHELNVLKTMRL